MTLRELVAEVKALRQAVTELQNQEDINLLDLPLEEVPTPEQFEEEVLESVEGEPV